MRRLASIETLGSTTVVGSDKTGTLTENRMTVETIRAGGRFYDVDDELPRAVADRGPPPQALRTGLMTNEADLVHTPEGVVSTGDPTEVALLVAADAAGIDPGELRAQHAVVAEIPFEAERRYSGTIRRVDGEHVLFVKGAPERVVGMCT